MSKNRLAAGLLAFLAMRLTRAVFLLDTSILLGMTGLAGTGLLVWGLVLPHPPLQLAVEQDAGLLRIAWNPAASAGRALLEIQDGANRMTIPIAGALANICYAPMTSNIAVRVVGMRREGRWPAPGWNDQVEAHLEMARLSSPPAALKVTENELRFDRIESQLKALQTSVASGRKQIEALQRSADFLSTHIARHASAPATPVQTLMKPVIIKPTTERFWRD